ATTGKTKGCLRGDATDLVADGGYCVHIADLVGESTTKLLRCGIIEAHGVQEGVVALEGIQITGIGEGAGSKGGGVGVDTGKAAVDATLGSGVVAQVLQDAPSGGSIGAPDQCEGLACHTCGIRIHGAAARWGCGEQWDAAILTDLALQEVCGLLSSLSLTSACQGDNGPGLGEILGAGG